jgi:rhodanese-related sulfurtransferase
MVPAGGSAGDRRGASVLALLAATLGAGALVADTVFPKTRSAPDGASDSVDAATLAQWIRDGRGIHLIDVRPARDFAVYHLPGAASQPLSDTAVLPGEPGDTIVVYAAGRATTDSVAERVRRQNGANVFGLEGGLVAWIETIMEPVIAADAAAADRAAFDARAELSRWFGGTPRAVPSGTAGSPRTDGSEADASRRVGAARRQGC